MSSQGCLHGGEPTWLERISFIKTYAFDTCSTPWRVYLGTGGKALGNLAMTFLWIDTGDLVRSFLRPKAGRSGRHSAPLLGKGKRRIKQGVFPEPSDLIADTARSVTGFQKPKWSDGFNHIWEIDSHLQRVLNHVVFVNAATDFAYDWFSGILRNPASNCSLGRFAQVYEWLGTDDDQWHQGVKLGDPIYNNGALLGTNSIILEEGTWVFGHEGTFAQVGGHTGEEIDFLIFTGPTATATPCGRILDVYVKPVGENADYVQFSVVQAPCIVRVLSKVPSATPAHPFPARFSVWNGFRLK